jgi:hypothetical protein
VPSSGTLLAFAVPRRRRRIGPEVTKALDDMLDLVPALEHSGEGKQ